MRALLTLDCFYLGIYDFLIFDDNVARVLFLWTLFQFLAQIFFITTTASFVVTEDKTQSQLPPIT